MAIGGAFWAEEVMHGGWAAPAWTLGIEVVAIVAVFGPTSLLAAALSTRLISLDPRHELVVDLAEAYAIASGESSWIDRPAMGWRTDDKARRAFAKLLARTAAHVENRMPRIAPWTLRQVRTSLGDLGAGIAETLRHHARDVLVGGPERDDALAARLGSALVAASRGRWEELAVDTPAPRAQRFLRRFGPKLLGAAVLVAAALTLPTLFADWLGPAAQQARIALFVAAALILVDTPAAAFNRIADVFKQQR